MESSRDSTQSLHVLIYKETDGRNCYETNDLFARWRNWKRMRQCLLAIKGSELSSHYHALKEDSVLHPSYSPPHNLWSQYPHPRHVFPLCFHSLSFIINSHIPPLLKAPPVPNTFFPPCTHFSRYWPRPPVPVPGGCHGGWASHSQGCSVHSSHRLPWGLPLSAAVGCLPTVKERGKGIKRHINGIHCIFHKIWFWIGKKSSLLVMFLLSLTVTRKKKWKVHGNKSIGELFFVLF